MRKKVIAANWKMYKTSAEAKEFCLKLRPLLTAQESVQSIIFAPFTALAALKEGLADTDIAIGAQNFYPQNEGAYTGEISLNMLKEFGVTYVLIGHSERREIFLESNELIREKLLKALAEDFKPILCIGEPWEIREKGEALEYCLKQLESAFAGLNTAEIKKIVIAYEPIWAIGSGKSATLEDAEEMLQGIRRYLQDNFGAEAAEEMPLLYGGSVKVENIAQFMQKENIDGALIGGASLKAESFSQMIRFREMQK